MFFAYDQRFMIFFQDLYHTIGYVIPCFIRIITAFSTDDLDPQLFKSPVVFYKFFPGDLFLDYRNDSRFILQMLFNPAIKGRSRHGYIMRNVRFRICKIHNFSCPFEAGNDFYSSWFDRRRNFFLHKEFFG